MKDEKLELMSTRDIKNARRREVRKQKAAKEAAAKQATADYGKVSQSFRSKRSYRKTLEDDAGVAEATRELEARKANKAALIAQKTQEILSAINAENNGTPNVAMQGTPTTSTMQPFAAPPPSPLPRPLLDQLVALGRAPSEVEVSALHASYENDSQHAALSKGFWQFTSSVASLNSPMDALLRK